MQSAQARRAFLSLCREFLTSSTTMAREAIGRKQEAVTASMARLALSAETIRQSEERLVRCEQRIINAEMAWNSDPVGSAHVPPGPSLPRRTRLG